MAEVARRPPVAGPGRLAQVAGEKRAANQHLAIGGNAQSGVRECAARATRALRAGQVERLHRGALGEPITLGDRQAQAQRRLNQRRPDGRATDRHQLQAGRCAQALTHQEGDPRAQHLWQQDQAVRRLRAHHAVEARCVELRGAFKAQLGQRQRDHGGALPPRGGQAGQVLQEHRIGQGRQMAADAQRRERGDHAIAHRIHGHPGQADALGLARAARGEAEGLRARWQRHRCVRQWQGGEPLAGQGPGLGGQANGSRQRHQQQLGAGGLKRMLALRGGEEHGQRQVHRTGVAQRLVEQREGGAVVQQAGHHAAALQPSGGSRALCGPVLGRPGAARGLENGQAHVLTPRRRASTCSAASSEPASTTG